MNSPTEKPAVRIDFVSDVACPWCAVGLNSLEAALQTVGSVPSIVIDRAHLIQGGQPPAVFERALRQIADRSPA